MRRTLSVIRKLAVGAAGGSVMAAGFIMLLIPGPGIVTILAGLAILATEFAAARRLLSKLRRRRDP